MKAWIGKIGWLALLGLFLWSGTCFAADNLLLNGGFEEGDKLAEWEEDVWNYGDTYSVLTVSTDVFHSGGRSALIESKRENDAKWVQAVKVKPKTLYKLSGWVRAEGIGTEAKGANLSVLGSTETSVDLQDTDGEWLHVELYGRTGAKQEEIKVAVRLGGYGSLNKGKVWFDDVELVEAVAVPSGIEAVSFEEAEASSDTADTAEAATTGTPFKLMGYAMAFGLFYGVVHAALFRKNRLSRCSPGQLRLAVIAALAAGLILRAAIAPFTGGHSGDMNTFKAWATHAATGGLFHFYDTDMFVDYPPGYIYILYVLGKVQSWFHLGFNSGALLFVMKTPAMCADLITAWLLFRMASSRIKPGAALGIALLYIFNPAVLVNSTVWGQVDSFFAMFLLLTLSALASGKLERAGGLFALAVLIKPQALIFSPVLLFAYWRSGSLRRFGKSAAWGAGVFLAGIIPFSFVMKPWWIIELYRDTLMSYPYATLNAFNLYALGTGNWKPQTDTFLLFSYQTWGTIFIGVAVALALYYFAKAKHNLTGLYYYIALVLITTMFLFGAKMHERYWFPALALALAVYVHLKDRRVLGWFLGLSVCHFLNVSYTLSFYSSGITGVPARDGLLLLVSFASLLLFGYLLKIGYDGFIKGRIRLADDPAGDETVIKGLLADEKTAEDGPAANRRRLGLVRMDWLLMLGLTLLYAVIAFFHLGSTKAPETMWEPAVSGESFYVDFGSVKRIERINSFAEIGEGKFKLEFATEEAPEQWGNEQTVEVKYTKFFTWNVQKVDVEARYARLTVETAGFALDELAFYELDGEAPIPVAEIHDEAMTPAVRGSTGSLFDEPEDSHYSPTYMHGSYFDEIYHPRTAYEHLHNIKPYENTHPPLGKLIIAAGIKLFGMNPFGWRIMGTLFGIAMVPIMYIFGKRLFGRSEYAFMASFLFTFDFMHFAQTRIATIDTYGVFFIILMYYYMYRYISMSFYREPFKRTLVPLFLSGLFFGIGAASKWIVLYGGAGLAVLFFASLYLRYREFEAAGVRLGAGGKLDPRERDVLERTRRLFVPSAVKTVLWCVPFFVIIPGLIYSASFIPYMTVPGEGFSLHNLIQYQRDMWNYHSKLVATHGFASPWWEWPFMIKPIWFYSGQALLPDGKVSSIVSMGNPAVWWLGTLAVAVVIVLTWKRRNPGMLVVLTAFFSQYLPWMLVTRLTFIYHFFAMVPFIVLCLVYVFKVLHEERGLPKWVSRAYMGVVLVLFVLFYPVLSGLVVDKWYVRDVLRWFGTWYFYS